MVIGSPGGATASRAAGSGPVTTICRRSGVTGRGAPTIAPTACDQAPAQQTTAGVRTVPALVRTAVISAGPAPSDRVSIPCTVTPVTRVAPCRRAPAAYPATTASGVQYPSPEWNAAA